MTAETTARIQDEILAKHGKVVSGEDIELVLDIVTASSKARNQYGLHLGDGVPMTNQEFVDEANHIWLNAFLCIKPDAEFIENVGRSIIDSVMHSRIKTRPIGDFKGSRAAIFWVNAS